jgi:hypothetical protein
MTTPAPAAALPDGHLREPEKLVLPGAAIEELVTIALRTEVGATAWRFFAHAHGDPSWLTAGRWRLVVNGGALLPKEED